MSATVQPAVAQTARRIALLLSILVAAGTAIVLIGGWWMRIDWVTFLLPGGPTMKANTAAMLLLYATATAVLARNSTARSSWLAQGLAAAALLIAGLTSIEILFDLTLGIDQLLARDTWSPYAPPGQMSIGTAVCGMLLGCILLLVRIDDPRLNGARVVATDIAALIVLIVLCIYLFDLEALISVAFFSTMSLPTAASILALLIATIGADPERGIGPALLSNGAGSVVVRRLLLPIVLVPLIVGYSVYELSQGRAVAIAVMTVGCASILCAIVVVVADEIDRYDARRRKASRRMSEALQKAEAANQAKSRFLASASHDLRTPLNAIIGLSEVIRNETFGPIANARYQAYVHDIHRSGQDLLAIINSILDLARIEAGVHTIQNDDCELAGICSDVLRDLEAKGAAKRLQLENRVSPNLPLLRADPVMLRRMIVNLADNGVNFTPDGGRVTIGAELMANGGLRISVSDTGTGMDPSQIDRMLEAFEHAHQHATLAKGEAGLGLGLSIVKRFAALHDAELRIRSDLGAGTEVELLFPPDRTRPRGEYADDTSLSLGLEPTQA